MKLIFSVILFIFFLNILDIFSTTLCLSTGLAYESNPLAVMMWEKIGFSTTTLFKLLYPLGVYVWAEVTVWQARKRCTSRDLLLAKVVVASLLIFNVAYPLYAVINNFIVLVRLKHF